MRYHTVIIGAGMSGLAAGIRLAYYEKPVCILERHTTIGGLNSFYRLRGRNYDVGLHAVTNYAPPGTRSGPLAKLLKQLRLRWDDFALAPQNGSSVVFPGRRLRFANDFSAFCESVREEFPAQADRFRALVRRIDEFDELRLDQQPVSARGVLEEHLSDATLIDMLFCPLMFYGSAVPRDMDFHQFCIMFKSIFQQGFGRPPEGVRRILKTLTRHFKSLGGELKLRHDVRQIRMHRGRAAGVILDDGREIEAENVLSSAGLVETLALCEDGQESGASGQVSGVSGQGSAVSGQGSGIREPEATVGGDALHATHHSTTHHSTTRHSRLTTHQPGEISFNEAIFVLDCEPAELGHEQTIVFYNDAERFAYEPPQDPLDLRSGIICSPNNFRYAEGDRPGEGVIRVTALSNPAYWMRLPEPAYQAAKLEWCERMREAAERHIGGFAGHIVETDVFTPRTIEKFTGHINGAVYGAPRKRLSGTTPFPGLYLCGTDQGFLGIIGAMLSGITMANNHLLR